MLVINSACVSWIYMVTSHLRVKWVNYYVDEICIVNEYWTVWRAMQFQINSTQMCLFISIYIVDQYNIGLKPALVYLPHCYWVHIPNIFYLCVSHQQVNTCTITPVETNVQFIYFAQLFLWYQSNNKFFNRYAKLENVLYDTNPKTRIVGD